MLTLLLPPFLCSLPFRFQQCYVSLVEDLNVTDTHCLKYALSKGLGLGMVAGGAILKVPQIISVVSSGSAKGLSLSSYVLDTAATAITVAYNIRKENPFSTYGELGFLLVQNVRSHFSFSSSLSLTFRVHRLS
jgi:mannose-P-dolichol utilization defect protein 1